MSYTAVVPYRSNVQSSHKYNYHRNKRVYDRRGRYEILDSKKAKSADANARLWGLDLNVHGPVSVQANIIQGLVNFVNNYHSAAVPNKGMGAAIVTRAGSGGGDVQPDRSTRQTYPLDIGLAIVGWSGTPDKVTETSGFNTALQIGGNASGWMGPSETSMLGTGIDIRDYKDYGIFIHDRHSMGTGPAIVVAGNAGNVGIGTTSPSEILDVRSVSPKILVSTITGNVSELATMRLVGSNTDGSASQVTELSSYQPSGGGVTDAALDIKVRKAGDAFGAPSTVMTLRGDTGNVGIGTTSPTHRLHMVGGMFKVENDEPLVLFHKAGNVQRGWIGYPNWGAAGITIYNDISARELRLLDNGSLFYNGNVGIGTTSPSATLDVIGNIEVNGTVVHSSDRRLKEDIGTIDNALEKVKAMRGVQFRWKDRSRGEGFQVGLIGQEVEEVLPEAVFTADDELGTKSVAYGNLIGVLIEAIKEQQAQIEALEARLNAGQ